MDRATADLRSRLPAVQPEVVAYLRRLAVPGLDPEDLAQDVMERALRYEHAYDPNRELVAWLKGVALRVALDARRAAAKAAAARSSGDPDEQVVVDRQAEDVARRDEVERLLARLAPDDRTLLLAVHRDGRSIAEVAAERGVPVGTLKSRLHRARRRLTTEGRAG